MMTSSQAIVVGAAIIAVAVLVVGFVRPAEAQRVGPFALEHHSNPQALAGVFRLDTATGEVSYCYLNSASDLTCSKSVR